MSSDRFQFLEFEDEEARPAEAAFGQGADGPAQREIGAGLLLPDGTTLAEVRMSDPRGFQKYLEEDDGTVTLSSMAGQSVQEPNRLRIVEVLASAGPKSTSSNTPPESRLTPTVSSLSPTRIPTA